MNYKDVIKNLKVQGWEQDGTYTNVVVMTKGTKRILVDKSDVMSTIGYIVDDVKSKEHIADGELEDVMDVFKLDEVYGK